MDTITIYNGKEWATIKVEPIYENGIFTGHFKQINKTLVNKFGIFDDAEIYQKAIDDINNFRINNNSTMYIAQGDGYLRIFSTYAINPEYDNLGLAFMGFLESTGLAPTEYKITTFAEEPAILVDLKDKETEKTYQIYLIKGSNYIDTIR